MSFLLTSLADILNVLILQQLFFLQISIPWKVLRIYDFLQLRMPISNYELEPSGKFLPKCVLCCLSMILTIQFACPQNQSLDNTMIVCLGNCFEIIPTSTLAWNNSLSQFPLFLGKVFTFPYLYPNLLLVLDKSSASNASSPLPNTTVHREVWLSKDNLQVGLRAQKNILLPGSKPSTFIPLQTLLFFPRIPAHSVPVPFSPSFFPLPFFPFFPLFFLFPFFLPGKFEHFSCLPSSAASTLLHFFSPGGT